MIAWLPDELISERFSCSRDAARVNRWLLNQSKAGEMNYVFVV